MRVSTSSLAIALRTWVWTVAGLNCRRSAISLTRSPSASSSRIWRSRGFHRAGDVLGRCRLEHVAGGAGAQGEGEQVGLGVCREDDDFGPRPDLEHFLRRLDAVAFGQLDVDDQDVGLELLDHVDDIAAVARLADDVEHVGTGHSGLDRLADDLMVVTEDDSFCFPHTGAHHVFGPIFSGAPPRRRQLP